MPISPVTAANLHEVAPWTTPLAADPRAPVAFLCHDFVCEAPTSDPTALAERLGILARPGAASTQAPA
jgi:hypothetical protein